MNVPPPGRLVIDTEVREMDGTSVAIVHVAGEVDLANADELEAALAAGLGSDSPALVIDLTQVPFMDSSGLRILLMAARDRGARVGVVLGDGSPVMRLLEYAEMTDLMAMGETEEQVLRSVASEEAG